MALCSSTSSSNNESNNKSLSFAVPDATLSTADIPENAIMSSTKKDPGEVVKVPTSETTSFIVNPYSSSSSSKPKLPPQDFWPNGTSIVLSPSASPPAKASFTATGPSPPITTSVIHNPYAKKPIPPSSTSTAATTIISSSTTPISSSSTTGKRSTTNSTVRNPRQRRRRRPAGKPVMAPQNPEDLLRALSRMSPFDRFFSCLLQSAASDYLKSASNSNDGGGSEEQAIALYSHICSRAGVPVVSEPLQQQDSSFDDEFHRQSRASLVLEEARHAIAEAMDRIWCGRKSRNRMLMQLVPERKNHKEVSFGTKWTFRNASSFFTKEELFQIRPGTVVQILARGDDRLIGNTVLGVIVSGSNDRSDMFSVMCYGAASLTILAANPNASESTTYEVTILTSLVSECRSFEALISPVLESLDFFSTLVSGKVREKQTVKKKPTNGTLQVVPKENPYFRLPQLNKTQENAATAFLKSKPGTITLVQGPPGTGKTTLLVSIISRLLLRAKTQGADDYRVMVCAPTNKAIAVLASRFMDSILQVESSSTFSLLLVGDADKLLHDERCNDQGDKKNTRLQSIFLYSWIQSVIDAYSEIQAYFLAKNRKRDNPTQLETFRQTAHALEHRLKTNLPDLPDSAKELTESICTTLDSVEFGGSVNGIDRDIAALMKELKSLSSDQVFSQLLRSADVIFCTLVSSGGAVIKRTDPVSDLIVEEAAAATEPELYIPFHLKPSRLLAVGDPNQLPATVLSRASQLGLSKSLHERLMFDCDYPHVMLDIQYRMSCQISDFPSRCFYDSKIGNGSNVSSSRYLEGPVLLDRIPYTFYQVAGNEEQSSAGSFYNRAEATTIVDLVCQLRQHGSPGAVTAPWYSSDRVRIITFYTAQVTLIKRLLHEKGIGNRVLVATVDSSQGCEADIILISFVRSPSSPRNKGHASAGFLTDDRRMNVALTRARFQLICVGDVRSFQKFKHAETLHLLAVDAEERGVIRSASRRDDEMNNRLDAFYGPT